MEAFSLLKYWRGGGGVVVGGGDSTLNSHATTIVTAVAQNTIETDDDEDDDDGPFFDLEFAVPDEEDDDKKEKDADENEDIESENEDEEDDGEGTDGEREFNFTLSSGSSNDRVDQNLPLSPSDDLFFKGRLVPIEPSSLVLNGSEPNSKPQFPVSLLKSATKFRVFMLGFKKSKMNSTEKSNEKNGETSTQSVASPTSKQQQHKQEEKGEEGTKQSKFFTVKFKVEEVPIVSLFTRESSKNAKSSQKQNNTEENASAAAAATSDEKRFSKDVMQKYLKKVKPLYIRVSKRYGEKLRFSGQLSLGSALKASAPSPPPPPPSTATTAQKSSPTTTADKSQPETESTEAPSASNVKSLKQGNLPAGLRVVCKHLGKSRSASSAVAAAPSAPVISKRRDDSLLQQQDGIQSAILHCKRSFNASRDSDSSLLSRSVSDPSYEKPLNCQGNHQTKEIPFPEFLEK
ncbi:hypothetical protein JCGZ_20524 [Jatropha curcas]|uniref:Membrane-associated kinase regulator 2 n=1 Tax=Jatropha curcas TaxID=180498 RepID=A0A067JRC6_JATCU|nr:probable membrane-associated kinase regulator 2 [Jatropha curcas]KDP25368.1 hypothetical protein JCGZ_20524 [Jatropha curcas]